MDQETLVPLIEDAVAKLTLNKAAIKYLVDNVVTRAEAQIARLLGLQSKQRLLEVPEPAGEATIANKN